MNEFLIFGFNFSEKFNSKSIFMGFIIGCIVYVVVCEGICKMLELEEFNKKAWVYAIVGCVGSFLIKGMM